MGILIIIGLFLSLVGASFIASKIFNSIWKTNVSSGKMTVFLTTFLLSFLFIGFIIIMIVSRNMDFGR
jgi:hypothetical protein